MAGAPETEVRLEGFAENLKGHRVYCIGSPAKLPALVRSRLAILDTEVAHRGRKVLFLQDHSAYTAWLMRMKWDAIFVVHDALDLRLGLTYVTNAAKPVRLVWAGGEPGNPVFAALARAEGVSVLGFGVQQPQAGDWEAIFWTHDVSAEMIEPCLNTRMGYSLVAQYNVRSVLREIAASDVGLVWSTIGEKRGNGSLYWFDPAEGAGVSSVYTPIEAAELLRSVADFISPKEK